MPYIPFIPIPPQPVPSILAGTTSGTIYTQDYTLFMNGIIKELNFINYNFSAVASLEPGTAAASLSAAAINSGLVAESMVDLLDLMQKMNTNLQLVANKIDVSTKGLANISSHMSEQVVTQQMALTDQLKNNKFQQQTTNQSLADAGKPPTVVSPVALVEQVKSIVEDVSVVKAQTTIGSLTSEAITSAGASAVKTATEWAAQSAIVAWIKDAYVQTEILVVGLFSKEKALALKRQAEIKAAKVRAGGPP